MHIRQSQLERKDWREGAETTSSGRLFQSVNFTEGFHCTPKLPNHFPTILVHVFMCMLLPLDLFMFI